MELFLSVFYLSYRLFLRRKSLSVNAALRLLGKFLLYGINAALISAIIMLPILSMLLSESRIGRIYSDGILYSLQYYMDFIAALIGFRKGAKAEGFSVIALMAVIVLFIKRHKYTRLKYAVVFLSLFYLIPFFTYAISGFSYAINRWVWAYSLLLSYVVISVFPDIFMLKLKEKRIVAIAGLAVGVLPLLFSDYRNVAMFSSSFLIAATIAVICLCDFKGSETIKMLSVLFILHIVWLYIITDNLYINQNDETSEIYLVSNYHDPEEALDILENRNSDAALKLVNDTSFYRLGQHGVSGLVNTALQRRINRTDRYYSMSLPCISEFSREFALNVKRDFNIADLNMRSILESLMCVRYYLAKEGSENGLPFNYKENRGIIETYDGRAGVWKNAHSMPLGYTYASYISRENFDKMDYPSRQEAILNGVVLDNSDFPQTDLHFNNKSILDKIEVEEGEVVSITDNTIEIKRGSAILKFGLDESENSEIYVVFDRISRQSSKRRYKYSSDE